MLRTEDSHLPDECRKLVFLLSMLFVSTIYGCGAEVYEKRLQETVKYYTYLEKVNNAVVDNPFFGDGVSIRVPKKFNEIPYNPRAAKKKNSSDDDSDEGEDEEPKDPRQPDYMDIELPGLEAAWTVSVTVPLGDKDVQRPVYLYAMSNAARWRRFKKEGAKDPKELHNDLAMALGQELDMIEFLQDAKNYSTIEVPEPNETRYAAPKKYTAITLTPEGRTINDVETEFHVYLYSEGDAFAALLLVIPLNANPSDRIVERMEIALHTLEAYKPNVTAAPATGGGNPPPQKNQGGAF